MRRGGGAYIHLSGVRGGQFGDGVSDAQSMTSARDTDILQRLVIDVLEQIHVDVVDLEGIAVLAKADRLQLVPDLAHALSCSSSALASFKSSVSKPSVNQP
jgi:hypothetical protein